MKLKMGSYYFCKNCGGLIVRNGKTFISHKNGEELHFHNHCVNKLRNTKKPKYNL